VFDQTQLHKAPALSLEACVDLWLRETLERKRDKRMPAQNAEHLRPYLRGRSVAQTTDAVRGVTADWRGTLSPATINRRLAVLRASLRHAWRAGMTAQDYGSMVRMLPEPRGREVFLTPGQVEAIAGEMTVERGREAILLLAYTGLRAGELLGISSADLTSDAVLVRSSKNGRPRSVPIPASARHLLSALPLGLSYSQLQWSFRSARNAAGLPHVRLHDLRHTCASWLVNKGVPLPVIAKILGHLAPQTTYRYAHVLDSTAQEAMDLLGS